MTSLNLAGLLDVLAAQDLLLGLFLAGTGMVFMILGARIFRTLVAISFGIVGFVLGGILPIPEELQLACAFFGALVLAVLSTFIMRVSVGVLAGLWAAYAAILLMSSFDLGDNVSLALGALAFVAAASLSIIMYREVIAFVMSMEGTLLFIAGLIIFLNQSPVMWSHIRSMMVTSSIFAPFLLLAGTVTGFYLQMAELRQRDSGVSA
ncbi:MAG: hypothetical protein AMXMBFR13_45940 [Phycisphaerae bacterium]